MVTVVYDGTFEGLLTAFFDVYEYKFTQVHITGRECCQPSVFGHQFESHFDSLKSSRVWKGLALKLSATALSQVYKAFLSEEKGIEDLLLQYVRQAFAQPNSIECDFSNPAVLSVAQMAKKVHREKHRMEAFVRFQLTADNLYYAICQPDFNVLPLIKNHFKNRYSDQRWLIYDSTRKYGIYYDMQKVEIIQLSFSHDPNDSNTALVLLDENEELYQKLWQQYFNSVNIPARKNTRLHIQHMPKRYWKYLPEKGLF